MYQKILAAFLSSYLFLIQAVVPCAIATIENPANLKEFLQQHQGEEITVEYTYPSMRLAAANTKGTVLPAGTPVVLRSMDTINSSTVVSGQNVQFQVVQDVKVNGKVLVKSGSTATAIVSYTKKKTILGIPGKITISDFSLSAVDGTYVPLSASIDAKGEDQYILSLGVGIFLCFPFLFVKGEDATIPAGTSKSAYTVSDVTVNTEHL